MKILALTIGLLIPQVVLGDLQVVKIDPSTLPYELSPSNYDNSPSNYANSASNHDNSSSRYKNLPSNSSARNRRLLIDQDVYVGYYVQRDDGRTNYFYARGERFGYTPKGGHTQSVFSDGDWCGTLGESDGESVLGLKSTCYEKLIKEVREEQEASQKWCLEMYERYQARLDVDPRLAEAMMPMLITMDCGYLLSDG